MSSESIDLLWNDSINELKQLVQQEEKCAADGANKPGSISEAFHHFAKLYIRYTIVLSDLNKCYDSSIQTQKRLDIKSTLEHIILRVINLRHLLSKWCPPNPDVLSKVGVQSPFYWEYVDISMDLMELDVPPSKLEILAPVYFKEDQMEATCHRNSKVARLLKDKFGTEVMPLEERTWSFESSALNENLSSTAMQSVEISNHDEIPNETNVTGPGQAAARIQRLVRGHLSRNKTKDVRRWLDNLVGLRACHDKTELDKLEGNLIDAYHQRKQEQEYCKESYENDLHRLKDVVRGTEGFAMQNALREERIQWITEHTICKNRLPDSFEGFYTNSNLSQNGKENKANREGKGKQKGSANGAKGTKGDNKKSHCKKSAGAEKVDFPVLAANPTLICSLRDCIRIYEERWQHKIVGPGRIKSQYHDAEMVKDLIIRGQVKSELTKGVEEKLLSNILKIKAMQDANPKKSKSKKGSKAKRKKANGKNAKGKKEKPLPGAKLPRMKETTVEEMLGVLVHNGLACLPEKHTMKDFIGGFKNGRPKLPKLANQERWIPDDPSAFQLRNSIMEYCILPLGSASIKSSIQDAENVRSILFYGPEGSGKTLMVQAIASEIGALLINLSSSTIGNSFGGKEGATKLIHMAFTVAKEKDYAPVIIHLDNCHDFFMGKSKKVEAGLATNADMQRFQKSLLTYKNLALKKEDRAIVIGCTSMPGSGDVKLLRWKGSSGKLEKQGFFERSLYFPRVDYADRAKLWKDLVQQRIQYCKKWSGISDIDYSALASLSVGFNAGEISSMIDSVLSEERMLNLLSMPLTEHDFSGYLSRDMTSQDDERFLAFTRQITSLDSAWRSANGSDRKNAEAKKKKK